METPPPPQPSPRRRLPIFAIGGVAAVLAGLGIAWALVGGGDGTQPAPASEAGLVIDSSANDDGRIDPARPLRCFVQGQFVGELSLNDCARRNGVATDALDVGLDPTGSLAAAGEAGQTLTPLPPPEEVVAPLDEGAAGAPEVVERSAPAAAPAAACWRYGGGRWRKVAADTELDACVQALFTGRCEKPGGASYGRWGQQTLRLVAGRVETSDDNKSFRMLTVQSSDCMVDHLG